MLNKELLESAIQRSGKTKKEIATALGIDYSTLYRKLIGESELNREEIGKLCKLLGITDLESIFFAE